MPPKKAPSSINMNKFGEVLWAESDRACAVLGAAMLDALLEDLFRKRLTKHADELLSHQGALSTFSGRIMLARALEWISAEVQADLDAIRRVRNDFAHHIDHELSFEIEDTANRCHSLRVVNKFREGVDAQLAFSPKNVNHDVIRSMADAVSKTPRQRYMLAVDFLAQHIQELTTDADYLAGLTANGGTYAGPNLGDEVYGLGFKMTIVATGSFSSDPTKALSQAAPPSD